MSSYMFFGDFSMASWKCKKQLMVALSSKIEAEYTQPRVYFANIFDCGVLWRSFLISKDFNFNLFRQWELHQYWEELGASLEGGPFWNVMSLCSSNEVELFILYFWCWGRTWWNIMLRNSLPMGQNDHLIFVIWKKTCHYQGANMKKVTTIVFTSKCTQKPAHGIIHSSVVKWLFAKCHLKSVINASHSDIASICKFKVWMVKSASRLSM